MKISKLTGFFGFQKSMTAMLLMAIFVGLGEKMAERFLPIYLMALGGTPIIIGLLNGMDNLLSALYSYPGGWLADKFGYKKALLVFNSMAIFGYLIVVIFPAWYAVLIGAMFFLSWTAISLPATMTLVSTVLPKNKHTMGISLHSLIRRIPMALGPVIGGFFIMHYGRVQGVRYAFLAAIFFAIIAVIIQQRLIEEKKAEPQNVEQDADPAKTKTRCAGQPGAANLHVEQDADPAKTRAIHVEQDSEQAHENSSDPAQTRARCSGQPGAANPHVEQDADPAKTRATVKRKLISPNLRNLLISDILVRFCEQIPYAFVVIWVMDNNGLSAVQFGALTAIEMVTAMLIYIPIAYLADKGTRKPYIAITFFNFAMFPLVIYFCHSFTAFVFAFILRGLKEFGEPTRKSLILFLAPEDAKAITFGKYYLIRDVIVSASAFGGAWLWKASPQINFFAATGFGILGLLYFILKVKTK